MCGIAGFIDARTSRSVSELEAIVSRMTYSIRHRGPDDFGSWVDANDGVAIGHRRLSIIDLSPLGHQPMHSRCGRFVIVFNGEVYNYRGLRVELENLGHAFHGQSDTEVMLASIAQWGVENATRRFIGMFAFALWDKQYRELYLVRDRMGEKPLYYGWMKKNFMFGSELKALQVHPDWECRVDDGGLALFMRHGYIPAPRSIYVGIRKLLPGTLIRIKLASLIVGSVPPPQAYWSMRKTAERGLEAPSAGNEGELTEQLDCLLRDAVSMQMVSDVPVGAFLSGGIDSSTIVALMQAQSARPIKTFTVGFHENEFNEAEHGRAVAKHIGTDHTEWYVTADEAMATIPELPTMFDEPFADSSQIPTHLVARLARKHVIVSLSGDGGDELFGGYSRYFEAEAIWNRIRGVPLPIRRLLASLAQCVPARAWDTLIGLVPCLHRHPMFKARPGDRVQKLASVLSVATPDELNLRLLTHWTEDGLVLKQDSGNRLTDLAGEDGSLSFIDRMMLLDSVTYPPDDILVKVDRASMSIGLESRVPFLDHRVVEFAWSLPQFMKTRGQQGKWILRKLLDRYVPRKLIDRPKMGFGVPIEAWLRGPLRDWAEGLLNGGRLSADGYLDAKVIRHRWHEHLTGVRNWQHQLWDVLMFQAWLKEQKR